MKLRDLRYPAERTLVVWECILNDWLRTGEDPLHMFVWQGFERSLLAKHSPVERLVTTWEDIYEREIWQQFLEIQGYRPYGPAAPAAFVKPLS